MATAAHEFVPSAWAKCERKIDQGGRVELCGLPLKDHPPQKDRIEAARLQCETCIDGRCTHDEPRECLHSVCELLEEGK
jgi:hypothetical protein